MSSEACIDELRTLTVSKVWSTGEQEIVSVCSRDGVVLAGSETGSLLLWKEEPEQGKQVAELDLELGASVNCMCSVGKNQWLVGCGNILLFVTYSSNQMMISHKVQFSDEINSIDANDKKTFSAVADDNGCVTIIDLKTRKVYKKLMGHENICSCVKFRPKSPWSVVSAGLDCELILWNFNKGKVLGSVNMSQLLKAETEKDSYVVNPPLIHSISLSNDGLIAAAALENGKVLLLTIGGKGFKLASVVDAHSQGVSSVSITDDLLMFTCGNDAQINAWKLSTARAPGKTLVWATQSHSSLHSGKPSSIAPIEGTMKVILVAETATITIYDCAG